MRHRERRPSGRRARRAVLAGLWLGLQAALAPGAGEAAAPVVQIPSLASAGAPPVVQTKSPIRAPIRAPAKSQARVPAPSPAPRAAPPTRAGAGQASTPASPASLGPTATPAVAGGTGGPGLGLPWGVPIALLLAFAWWHGRASGRTAVVTAARAGEEECTECEATLATLRGTEEKLRAMLDAEPECVKLVAADGTLLDMNPAGLAMIGAGSLAQVRGQSLYPLIAPEYRAAFRALTEAVFGGESGTLRFVAILQGQRRWLETHVAPLRGPGGEPVAALGITRDVTEAQLAEDTLRGTKAKLLAAFQGARDGLLLADVETQRFLLANHRICAMLGYTEAELLGLTPLDLHPAEVRAEVEAGFLAFANGAQEEIRAMPTRHKDGSLLYTDIGATRLDLNGRPCLLWTFRDVTAERAAALARHESEAQAQALFHQGALGIAYVDLDGHWLEVNARYCQIVGRSWADLLVHTFQEITHPGDLGENLGLQGRLLAGEIPNFTVEKRYLRPDGTVVWANVTVSLIRAEAGQPRYFVVIAEDIDARKRMEEALRAAERHSRAVLDSLFSFVGVLSLDGLLLDANRAPFAAAGLTPESQIGRPFVDTFWIDHSPESRTAFGQLLGLAAGGAVVRADLPVRLATDHIAVMDMTFGPLRDETGRPVQIVGSGVDVTQRVAAEARLRQAERQRAVYQRLIEDATQAIGMAHLDARLSYINPALRELARMGPEVDVSQLTIFDLYTPETTALLQAEVLPAVMEQGRWSGELRLRTWTGEVRDTYQNAFRVDDEDGTPQACATVMTDITERKRAEEALRQASTRLAVAAEASGIGIWEWDPTTQTVTWDERQYALFGISPAERPQVTYEDWRAEVLPEDLAVYEAHLLAAVAQGQPVQGEFRIRLPDGEIRHIKAAARPYWANGTDAAPHYIGVNWDVTAERLQQRHLAQAKEAAESATEAKSRFLANMSHEIRTPLNAVIGLTQVLLHSDLDGRQRSLLAKVEIAAKTLLDIISDILDFSKIEADRLTLESSPFRLSEVIDNLAHLMALKAEEKGLDLFLRVAPDCPDALAGDPLRLQQVLLNLIGNAVKFTVQGEVRLDCALDARLGAGEGGQGERARLRFTVTDTGVGIAPAERERLFLPFSQADSSTTRRFGGTGLGLAISRQLVALMGGEIAAEGRDPLPGSRFVCTVTLPVRDWQPRGGAGLPKGLRCLIAAASASGREDLAEILTQRGAQVTTVADAVAARTALRSAQAAGGAYALLMLDLALPDPDPDPHPDPHPGDPAAARRFVASLDLAVRPRICLLVPTFHTPLADGVPPPGVDALLAKPHTPWSAMEAVRQSLSRDLATPSRHTKMRRVSPWSTHVGARILLVEDNEVNQEVVRHLLEEAGLQVDVAGSGLAALELAKSCHYDACLMDIQMPEMSGYEVTERLRAQPGTAALPILALTAHTTPEDRVRCREAGMNGFLSKPIDVRELFATLRRWLPPRQAPLPPLPRPDAGPDAGPAPPALAGMDWDEALGRMRGDQGLLRRLLATFARQQRDLPARLDRALAAADGPALRHLAHTLKGVSGNFAMHRLTALAARLELAAGQRAKVAPAPSLPAPCAALVAEVKAELAVVLIGVAAHLGETEAGNLPAQEVLPMDAPAPSLTELTELTGLTAGLVLLDGLLARHSLAASGPSAALARRWAGTPYAPALRRIAQAVDELDFAQARAALARLRAELEG